MRWTIRTLAAVLAATLVSGCYAYRDIEPAAVAPGSTIRVALERQEAVRQIDALGGLREQVEGRVAEQTTGQSLALTVRQAATPAQGGMFNAFLAVPWSSVTRVELKHFSPHRTVLAGAGAGIVAIATLQVLNAITEGNSTEDPGTNDAVRIPLIRLRW